MSKPRRSSFALAYVGAVRRRTTREATWMDVAIAYDEALRHACSLGIAKRRKLESYMRALHVVNVATLETKS